VPAKLVRAHRVHSLLDFYRAAQVSDVSPSVDDAARKDVTATEVVNAGGQVEVSLDSRDRNRTHVDLDAIRSVGRARSALASG